MLFSLKYLWYYIRTSYFLWRNREFIKLCKSASFEISFEEEEEEE